MKTLTEEQINELVRLYVDEEMAIQPASKQVGTSPCVAERYLKDAELLRTKEENTQIRLKKYRATCLEKYGCENVSGNAEIKEKKKQTCLQNYGVENGLSLQKAHDMKWYTNGINNLYIHKNELVPEGYYLGRTFDNPFIRDNVKEKIKQTCLEKYGYENPQQCPTIKEKVKQTNLERYGVTCAALNPEVAKKREHTSLEKYGVKDHIVACRKYSQYYFDNIYFDSKPELCYYVWCKNKGYTIIREPYSIEYFDTNANKKRRYYPDFLVNDQLIEIKSEFYYQKLITYNSSKLSCMIANGVKIILDKEYKHYVDYVVVTYGREFINNTKIVKNID